MYIKKKDKELFNALDSYLQIPKNWNKFVDKQKKKHNLIIKNKSEYYCTYCKNTFNARKKINKEIVCPYCKNRLLIKSKKLKYYHFMDYLAILDKYEDLWIIRHFALESFYNGFKMCSYCYEYGRELFDSDWCLKFQLINKNVIGAIGGMYLKYNCDFNSIWRIQNSYYGVIPESSIFFPGNIKQLFKTVEKYKYSQLWILVKKISYCDLIYILKNYNYSVELLIKMKLYNLALNPKTFKNKTSFEYRFYGLTKEYLPFIQKYNLNLHELEVLSLTKIKNISIIRKIAKIFSNLSCLKEIIDIINPIKAIKFTDLNYDNHIEYKDYILL